MNKRAMSFVEYVILMGILLVSLTAMSTYLKRGIQARLKDTADGVLLSDLATQNIAGTDWPAHQYVPIQNRSSFLTTTNAATIDQVTGNTQNKDTDQLTDKRGIDLAVTEGFEELLL